MTSPSDLVALVARLRSPDARQSDSAVMEAAAAIEQLQAELADCHRAITIWDASDLKARPAVEQYARAERAETEAESLRAELATALEDASELRALDNEAQHGADALRAELAAANLALKLKPRPYADADLLIEERDAARAELAAVKAQIEIIRDKLVSTELLEALAAVEHNRWAGWMRYQETASAERRADWPRKAALAYTQLTHDEQESDREEVRTTLAVIEDSLNAAVRAAHAQAGGK